MSNIFTRAASGTERLYKVFWLLWVPFLVLAVFVRKHAQGLVSDGIWQSSDWPGYICCLLFGITAVWLLIAIWKCASNTSLRVWFWLSRIYVVAQFLGLLKAAAIVVRIVWPTISTEDEREACTRRYGLVGSTGANISAARTDPIPGTSVDKLRGFFGRLLGRKAVASPPGRAEVDTPALTDVQILRDSFSPSSEAVCALTELVKVITSPLDPALRHRLMSKVGRAETGEDATEILLWALTRDTGEPEVCDEGRWTICIDVDWRGSDEIEWQANEVLATLKIEQRWKWGDVGLCPVGLLEFNNWLARLGYTLMHVDTGSDSYLAFVVAQSAAGRVLELAQASGARVESSEQFAGNFSASGEPLLISRRSQISP